MAPCQTICIHMDPPKEIKFQRPTFNRKTFFSLYFVFLKFWVRIFFVFCIFEIVDSYFFCILYF